MKNNNGLLFTVIIIVVAILGYLIGSNADKDRGISINKGDSVGEIIEEVGDEIDDATTN